MVQIIKPSSFETITNSADCGISFLGPQDKDFWKHCFSMLKEGGSINLTAKAGEELKEQEINSYLKMNGFTQIEVKGSVVTAIKPKWQAQGASLKRNAKKA